MAKRQKFGYVTPKLSKADQEVVEQWGTDPEAAAQKFFDTVHARAVAKEVDPDPILVRAAAAVSKLSPIAVPERLRDFMQREHLS